MCDVVGQTVQLLPAGRSPPPRSCALPLAWAWPSHRHSACVGRPSGSGLGQPRDSSARALSCSVMRGRADFRKPALAVCGHETDHPGQECPALGSVCPPQALHSDHQRVWLVTLQAHPTCRSVPPSPHWVPPGWWQCPRALSSACYKASQGTLSCKLGPLASHSEKGLGFLFPFVFIWAFPLFVFSFRPDI